MQADPGGSQSGPPKPKRVRRRRGYRARNLGFFARIKELERNLVLVARDAYGEMFGGREDSLRPFRLDLSVSIDPTKPWRLTADPTVEEQIRSAIREMAARAEAFRPGRVYCYRCDSAECPHSTSPGPTSVFGGYASTGLPRWPEFTQVLLDMRHPEMDLLFDPQGQGLVAGCMDAEVIKGPQLNVFGRQSKAYDILGQVVFGFLRISHANGDSWEVDRIAFTIQAVESRRLDGSARVELNVIGRLWDGSPAIDALSGPHQLRVLQTIVDAQRRINQLGSTSRAGGRRHHGLGTDVPLGAMRILKEMAGTIERLGRQKARRTIHAEERRVDHRPTSKAREDASSVSDDQLLWDEQRGTVVVVGPRNRVHVFSPSGRHVTSLLLEADAIRSRLRRRRWRQLQGDPLMQFRNALGRPDRRSKSGSPVSTFQSSDNAPGENAVKQGPTVPRSENRGRRPRGGTQNNQRRSEK
jgi:hypothetical protein